MYINLFGIIRMHKHTHTKYISNTLNTHTSMSTSFTKIYSNGNVVVQNITSYDTALVLIRSISCY